MIDFSSWILIQECLNLLNPPLLVEGALLTESYFNEARVEDLPELLKKNDQNEFFSIIYKPIKSAIIQYFVKKNTPPNIEDVENIAQETCMKIIRNHQGDLGVPMMSHDHNLIIAWARQVATRQTIDYNRRKKAKQRDVHNSEIPEWEPDRHEAPNIEDREIVQIGLSRLDPEQSKLLKLIYFQGTPIKTIAQALNTKENTVKSRVRAAQLALGRIIQTML